jgi:hypothetical protein
MVARSDAAADAMDSIVAWLREVGRESARKSS